CGGIPACKLRPLVDGLVAPSLKGQKKKPPPGAFLLKSSRLLPFGDEADRRRAPERFGFPPDPNKTGLFHFIGQLLASRFRIGGILSDRLKSEGHQSPRFQPTVQFLKHADAVGPKGGGVDGEDPG